MDLDDQSITQNPREVASKIGKPMVTFLDKDFKEGEEVLAKRPANLDETALCRPDDPLFPARRTFRRRCVATAKSTETASAGRDRRRTGRFGRMIDD